MTRATVHVFTLAVGAALVPFGSARADSIPLVSLGALTSGNPSTGHAGAATPTGLQLTIPALTDGGAAGSSTHNSNALLGLDLDLLGVTGPNGDTAQNGNVGLQIGADLGVALGGLLGIDLGLGVDVGTPGGGPLLDIDLDVNLQLPHHDHGHGQPDNCLPHCPTDCPPPYCPPYCPTDPPGGPTSAVPAPPGVVLAGFGMGCVLLGRLRRLRSSGRGSASPQN